MLPFCLLILLMHSSWYRLLKQGFSSICTPKQILQSLDINNSGPMPCVIIQAYPKSCKRKILQQSWIVRWQTRQYYITWLYWQGDLASNPHRLSSSLNSCQITKSYKRYFWEPINQIVISIMRENLSVLSTKSPSASWRPSLLTISLQHNALAEEKSRKSLTADTHKL